VLAGRQASAFLACLLLLVHLLLLFSPAVAGDAGGIAAPLPSPTKEKCGAGTPESGTAVN